MWIDERRILREEISVVSERDPFTFSAQAGEMIPTVGMEK